METVLSKDTVVFTLDDSRNLGYGDVELKEGQWPQHVVLRLLKFRGLEGLNIEVNQVQFEVNLPHSDDKTTINFDDQGKRTDQSDKAVYHVHVRRVKEPTAIEVEIPKELLPAQGKSLSFHWTDFYRR